MAYTACRILQSSNPVALFSVKTTLPSRYPFPSHYLFPSHPRLTLDFLTTLAFLNNAYCPRTQSYFHNLPTFSATMTSAAKQHEQTLEEKKTLKDKYPEIYNQTNIDRRGNERVVPMEILSLGMGRTGTMCEFLFIFVYFCGLGCGVGIGARV